MSLKIKCISVLFLLILNVFILFGQGRKDFNFKFDGVDRHFVLAVPTGTVPAGDIQW